MEFRAFLRKSLHLQLQITTKLFTKLIWSQNILEKKINKNTGLKRLKKWLFSFLNFSFVSNLKTKNWIRCTIKVKKYYSIKQVCTEFLQTPPKLHSCLTNLKITQNLILKLNSRRRKHWIKSLNKLLRMEVQRKKIILRSFKKVKIMFNFKIYH